MATPELLTSQLRKLSAASAYHSTGHVLLRHTAVQGVFHALSTHQAKTPHDARDHAVSACLEHLHSDVVLEASQALVQLAMAGGISGKDATDLILRALPTAGQASACALADALCAIQLSMLPSVTGGHMVEPQEGGVAPKRWSSHPFSAALLLNPSCGARLAGCSVQRLSTQGFQGSEFSMRQLWGYLSPFYAFVLLQGCWSEGNAQAAATWSQLPSILEGLLVRLACSCAGLSKPVLQLMTRVLPCCSLANEADKLRVMAWVPDIMDVLEVYLDACTAIDGTATAELSALNPVFMPASATVFHLHDSALEASATILQLRDSLVRLCWDAQPLEGQIAVPLAALVRMQKLLPKTMRQMAPSFSLLSFGSTEKDRQQLHLLLHHALECSGEGEAARLDGCMAAQPIACSLAYGSTPTARNWACHLLKLISRLSPLGATDKDHSSDAKSQNPTASHSHADVGPSWHGDQCLLHQSRLLLQLLWCDLNPNLDSTTSGSAASSANPVTAGAAIRWLQSLEQHLHTCRCQLEDGARGDVSALAGTSSSGRRGTTSALMTSLEPSSEVLPGHQGTASHDSDPNGAACMVLAALLAHPSPSVCVAAASALKELLLLSPFTSMSFLPLVLVLLQRHGVQAKSLPSPDAESASVQLSLLHLLPAMTADSAVAPFALRVLQQLLQPTSPMLMRCLGMHLIVEAWRLTGRGWPRVEAALVGYSSPSDHPPPLQLRLTRANLVRSICVMEPFKGVDLVTAIQDCMKDESVHIAAAGMVALTALCREDAVDFYKAIPIVHRSHPRPPKDPLLAAAWVSLLSTGALDAESHPERASATLEALWSATSHPSALVRTAAYCAIADYPIDMIERMEACPTPSLPDYITALIAFPPPPPPPPTESTSCQPSPNSHPESTAANRIDELAAVEALAIVAVQHEHVNRRRYMLLASAGAGAVGKGAAGMGGPATVGSVKSGAAIDREVASLKHRLAYKLPQILLGPLATGKTLSSTSTHGPQQYASGAALLCLRASTASSASNTASSAGSTAAFSACLSDALHRLHYSPWTHPALALHSWTSFFSRWISAARGDAARVWAELERCTTPPQIPSVQENSAIAHAALLAALASSATPVAASRLEGVMSQLKALTETEGPSSAVLRAALTALALAAQHLHPTDTDGKEAVNDALEGCIRSPSSSPTCRSAAAVAVSMMALAGTSLGTFDGAFLQATLSLLLSCTASCCPAFAPAVHEMAEGAAAAMKLPQPLQLVDITASNVGGESAESAEADMLAGSLQGLALLAGAVPGNALLAQLHSLCMHTISTAAQALPPTMHQAKELIAVIDVLPITCLGLYQASQVPTSHSLPECVSLLARVLESNTVLPGRLRGSAGRAMGVLLSSPWGLQLLTSPSQPQLPESLSLLDLLCRVAKGGGGGSQGSDAQCGALAGLAAVLQGPAAASASCVIRQPGSSTQPHAGTNCGGGLLASPDLTMLSARVLRCMESVASAPSDGRVQATASWLLAEVCASAAQTSEMSALAAADAEPSSATQGAPDSGGGSKGGEGKEGYVLRPLSAYPEEGAIRPLVSLLIDPSRTASLDTDVLSAVLRCLAASPRLPGMDWGAVCQRLWQQSLASSNSGMQEALLSLALAHGSQTPLKISFFINDLFTASSLRGMAMSAKVYLMSRLSDTLDCLAVSRATAILTDLPAQLSDSATHQGPAVVASDSATHQGLAVVASDSATHQGPAVVALLHGLAGVCTTINARGGKKQGGKLIQAVTLTLRTIVGGLSPLPPLYPGEVALLVTSALAAKELATSAMLTQQSDDKTNSGTAVPPWSRPSGGGADVRRALAAWGAALHCLLCAGPTLATEVTEVKTLQELPPSPSSPAPNSTWLQHLLSWQMRCLLVLASKGTAMAYKDLAPARTFCVDAPPSCTEALLPLLVQALAATVPQVAQAQMLREAFDIVRLTQHPLQALQVAASLVAVWDQLGAQPPCTAATAAPAVVAAHVTLLTPDGALACLPYTFPRLLDRPAWRSFREAALHALYTTLQDASFSDLAPSSGFILAAGSAVRPRDIMLACVLALRDQYVAHMEVDASTTKAPFSKLSLYLVEAAS